MNTARGVRGLMLVAVMLPLVAVVGPAGAAVGDTVRVSVASDGTEGDDFSHKPSISSDGLIVAFSSNSANLVDDDGNPNGDVFVHDRNTGTTTLVSVASGGGPSAGGASTVWDLTPDGRHVAFMSGAENLVDGDTNGQTDVFVHDRVTVTTSRVSVATGGVQATSPSGFSHSEFPSISADGRHVVFLSGATNLVEGDTNGQVDVFVHDRVTATTTRVSVDSAGTQGDGPSPHGGGGPPAISADGRYVAFVSDATNLVDSDTNSAPDVFVHDRNTGTTTRVSVSTDGGQAGAVSDRVAISGDGRHVAFTSRASNLVVGDTNDVYDVFVHDRMAQTTERVSVASNGGQSAGGGNTRPAITADGRHVAFSSSASDLVAGDTNGSTDVFVHDRVTGATTRSSLDSAGVQGNQQSTNVDITDDGASVAFESDATNLVAGDTNDTRDIFVHHRELSAAGTPVLALSKVAAASEVQVGELLDYVLTAANTGSAAATDVVLRDPLPDAMVFSAASDGCTEAGGTVTCTVGSLAAGASAARTITVTPSTAGTVTNTATVSASNASDAAGSTTVTVTSPAEPAERIFGTSRIETAVAASQSSYGDGAAGAVVLARADTFPDALAGAPLAVAQQAPLLLTDPASLHPATETELRRVLPPGGTVHLLGGVTALSQATEERISALGYEITRYPGTDRFETAVLISEALGTPQTVFVATGRNFPDALAAGAAAAEHGGVIVLTDDDRMVDVTADFLAAHPGVPRFAVGGPAAVADPDASPLVGADRYATALLVATEFFVAPVVVGVAVGTNFPDALSGDTHIARRRAPMLLVEPDRLPASVATYLHDNRSSILLVFLYGGEGAISAAVEAAIVDALS